jgi:hypothetical protein
VISASRSDLGRGTGWRLGSLVAGLFGGWALWWLGPLVLGPLVLGPLVLGPLVLGPLVLGPLVLGPLVLGSEMR